ncbi:hypothetical protein PSN13_06534 [Micromonospora saelicesensis]|uniref:Uncharacterized protein n=1 Tax=Micromonospora saelicesensis TaxID=285676 RepID=A0A328NC57_9ACTN|nr:hypothetical protein PSN13_06534 [Micromonospora saelicesensis]
MTTDPEQAEATSAVRGLLVASAIVVALIGATALIWSLT